MAASSKASRSPSDANESISFINEMRESLTGLKTLTFKIDKIEEGLNETLQRLTKLDNAMYDPDTGLFARIKLNEASAERRASELEQKFVTVAAWNADQENQKKLVTAQAQANDVQKKSVDEVAGKVHDILLWKTSFTRATNWVGVAVLTGCGGIIAKLVYDFLSGHVKLM